ncbi:kinase-like protein [Mytilinidion resinicola]|uniref:non-specific serine/threonine protein kinase n=1 Tax=Mytilinidion resinicola TaxID=574789 RepID=A0A6A6YGX4_9PEZI|nr:kinase-like protein [Mytilinidion resinicola]KAF2807828.1 kinase-like protein [Mytilinidion resinicola]
MSSSTPPQRELLMVGMSSKTYRIGDIVRKECHVLVDDIGITEENVKACKAEADVYRILGSHPLIAECLSIGPENEYVELKYYPNGNLKDYIHMNLANITESDLKRWAHQMIKSVEYIHSKGVRHSDFRLDQWLVDAGLNTRLSDFNASGFDDQPDLGLKGTRAQGFEIPSHCLPRDLEADNTVESDLFALGSTLYELVAGHTPYEGLSDELVESLFEEKKYPSMEGLLLNDIIMGCWKRKYPSAKDILHKMCGSRITS